jgi:hypothetical protein
MSLFTDFADIDDQLSRTGEITLPFALYDNVVDFLNGIANVSVRIIPSGYITLAQSLAPLVRPPGPSSVSSRAACRGLVADDVVAKMLRRVPSKLLQALYPFQVSLSN